MRKDDYSGGLFDSVSDKLTGAGAAKKERAEMETRMAKLEESIKQRSAAGPAARPLAQPQVQQAAFQGPYQGRPGAVWVSHTPHQR